MTRRIVIVGAGSLVKNAVDLFDLEPRLAYIHDEPLRPGEVKFHVPVEKRPVNFNYDYISVVGDPRHKRRLLGELEGAHFTNLVHPTCVRARTSKIGIGVFAQGFNAFYADTRVGDHCTFSGYISVGHDSVIDDYSTVCHHVALGGGVRVGEGTFLGLGCKVKPGIKIGEGALVGMGAVVIGDVPPNAVVAGVPAKFLKTLEPWK